MVKAQLVGQSVLSNRFVEIIEDRSTVGDGLALGPGFEVETQGVHVAVGADTRIAKQIPGAANSRPPFENQITALRTMFLQMHGGADTRDAGADNQYINVFGFVHSAALHRLFRESDVSGLYTDKTHYARTCKVL